MKINFSNLKEKIIISKGILSYSEPKSNLCQMETREPKNESKAGGPDPDRSCLREDKEI